MPSNATHPDLAADATVQWMVDDVALRCREALEHLAHPSRSVAHLGSTGMLLRSAADDLVSLVELLDGPNVADGRDAAAQPRSFDVVFGLHDPTLG